MLRLVLSFLLLLASAAHAEEFARFGAGDGPRREGDVIHLLAGVRGESNAVALPAEDDAAYESTTLTCRMRVLEGGDGGAFVFLNTRAYGARGPAPFVESWVEPNLEATFAVGIDVHNPPIDTEDRANWFNEWGNYLGNPEREVSLHWDGREIVKRLAPEEFRGDFHDVKIQVEHVIGGAEVTVEIAGTNVYDRYFVAGMLPYASRLVIGAGTRTDATTEFDVEDVRVVRGEKAELRRAPLHVEVFNHVLTDNSQTTYQEEVQLPPAAWAFGRIILTLDIHDAGPNWDEWDRCGEVYVVQDDGTKRGIVPFITSYRTPCHWKVDVTHFRPLLTGDTTFEVAAGTNFYKNRGYMMSVSLDFYHGTPELEAYQVVPLWHGTAKYRSSENHFQDFFEPQRVAIDAGAEAARVFTTTTGHSQIGEFVPSRRTLSFTPSDGTEPLRFDHVLWKTDCYLNPNRPQFGTWKFARAGWAPGDVVWPWWCDVTPKLEPGEVATLDYTPYPYEFPEDAPAPSEKQMGEASHNVRSYLILYRTPTDALPAPSVLVTGVAKDSNAEEAGMKAGDFIAQYDGTPVTTMEELRAALRGAVDAGQERVSVVVYRGSTRLELDLPTGQMGVNLSAP